MNNFILELKVSLVYFWEEYKDHIIYIICILFSPILFILVLLSILFICIVGEDLETVNEDIEWCNKNNYKYPEFDSFPHFTVKRYKREVNARIKLLKKQAIRTKLSYEIERTKKNNK